MTDYDAEEQAFGILRVDGAEPETIRTVFGLDGPKVRAIAQHHAPVPTMHLAELCDALAASRLHTGLTSTRPRWGHCCGPAGVRVGTAQRRVDRRPNRTRLPARS